MKLLRSFLAVFLGVAACALSRAADASPAGTWKWSAGRAGQVAEQTLKLDYQEGRLSGTLLGSQGGPVKFPDTPIAEATFKDGVVRFSVTREAGGRSATTKYEGKLEGDTLRGTREFPDLQGGGAPVRREWVAHRAK